MFIVFVGIDKMCSPNALYALNHMTILYNLELNFPLSFLFFSLSLLYNYINKMKFQLVTVLAMMTLCNQVIADCLVQGAACNREDFGIGCCGENYCAKGICSPYRAFLFAGDTPTNH